MSIQRIGWGVVAQAYNQGVAVLLQLVTTPMLIAAWGQAEYGSWMVISAVPAYLVLLDLGFSQVAANDMSTRMARAEHAAARRTFESLVGLFAIVILPILAVLMLLALVLPFDMMTADLAASFHSHRLTIVVFIAYVAAAILSSVVSAGLRAEGMFSLMVGLNTTSRLLSLLAIVTVAVLMHGAIEGAALAMLTVRVLATAIMIGVLYARSDLRLRMVHGEIAEARRLLWPSLMYLGFPLGNALSLQGVLIAIGVFLSPAAVTVFSTCRTLSRLGVNMLGAINHVFVFEYAVRAGQTVRLARVGLAHFVLEGLGALFFFGLLYLFGGTIYKLWLGGRVDFVPDLFAIVLIQSSLEVIWAACITPLIAWNRHSGIAAAYVVAAAVAISVICGMLSRGYTLQNSAAVLACLFGVLSIDAAIRLRRVIATSSHVGLSIERGHVS